MYTYSTHMYSSPSTPLWATSRQSPRGSWWTGWTSSCLHHAKGRSKLCVTCNTYETYTCMYMLGDALYSNHPTVHVAYIAYLKPYIHVHTLLSPQYSFWNGMLFCTAFETECYFASKIRIWRLQFGLGIFIWKGRFILHCSPNFDFSTKLDPGSI
jgi:hypothetical protein